MDAFAHDNVSATEYRINDMSLDRCHENVYSVKTMGENKER